MGENSRIIVCDQEFDVGNRVITFRDDPSISAYTPHCVSRPGLYPTEPAKGIGQNTMRFRGRRLIGADRSLSRLSQVLKQFVVHHDGLGTSRDCFNVLHDERGLSVHFLIDNNGDIYQTLDLVECAFQAAGVNEISIGVELCSRGEKLDLTPSQAALYQRYQRDRVTCTINGHQWLCWDYTREQYQAMTALGRALGRIFPGLPQAYPQESGGEPIWATLDGDVRQYSGYLGHFHVTGNKWDPGPWDFKRFIQSIRGRVFYPAIPGRDSAELPEEAAEDQPIVEGLYDNNERQGEGGYFPVGPLGETRLWHGGLHLRDQPGRKLVAPFAGRLLLARQRRQDEWPKVGSPNFVLLRHDLTVSGTSVRFFSLLMHVADESEGGDPPAWFRGGKGRKWWSDLAAGEVAQLDEPVGAGELIAHVGEAGRGSDWKGQVHFEVFAAEEIGETIEPGFWKTYDGSAGGRFCLVPEIVNPIDRDHSQSLAHSEVVAFFHDNPARADFRRIAVRHLSEWGDKNDFEAALGKARDFGRLSPAKKHQLFAEQIEPYLWWGDDLAALGLPADKIVWGYHPITFVAWLAARQRAAASQRARGVGSESAYGGQKPPAEIKDDTEGGAEGFTDDEDALFGEAAKGLDLEKLAGGYPD